MNNRSLIWGIVLIAIGGLIFLRNWDLFYFSWINIFRLWPMILIFIGIAMLPLKAGMKTLLSIIAVIVAVLILIFSPGWGFDWPFNIRWSDNDKEEYYERNDMPDQHIFEEIDASVEAASLHFDAAVGKFLIDQETDKLFEFDNSGNIGRYIYSIKELDNAREIRIDLEESHINRKKIRNTAEIRLNAEPVWDLEMNVGAANIDLDLRDFMINEVDISGGAASIELIIGDLYDDTEIHINGGATSIIIRVPESSACEVNSESILSTKSLKEFNEVSDGTYVTPNFADAENNIVINLDLAISTIKVVRY